MTDGVVALRQGQIGSVPARHPGVEVFFDVPFGVPVRFRPPRTAPTWHGIRRRVRPGPAAPQPVVEGVTLLSSSAPMAEESCLNASIWRPRSRADGLPVLVFVHGGANQYGSHADPVTDGSRLAAEGLVVISVHYRLGALGFLALDRAIDARFAESGAVAVHDIIAALSWVRANVEQFGGDPGQVTLFGQSAGAALAATVAASPLADGLVHRVVMSSGTAERALTAEDAHSVTESFLSAAGVSNPEDALRLSIERILVAQTTVTRQRTPSIPTLPMPFQPVLGTRAVPIQPLDAWRSHALAPVSLLAGTNLTEAAGSAATLTERQRKSAIEVLAGRASPRDVEAYSAAIAGLLGRAATELDVLDHLLTDVRYRRPTDRLLQARAPSPNTYGYVFVGGARAGDPSASAHASELPYFFNNLDVAITDGGTLPDGAHTLAEHMSSALVGFVRSGAPLAGNVDWESIGSEFPWLRVLSVPGADRDPLHDGDLWRNLRQAWSTTGAR
ncbi:carboxylesterase family protein [Microbacterium sp. PRC9]|uniref:carboxylesterase family protein n=1 Tax=Microbacterium sp. PRC9 TaxID=2962591 RepID=UPI002880CB07|nr:carboxylesterase family protein [Microbacterium sp. PRC9]MDT0144601.1 carboxylesterase family protein [Microbacterium sp. PRC9]